MSMNQIFKSQKLLQQYQQLQKKSQPTPTVETEPIVAQRVWLVRKHGGMPYLVSCTRDFQWPYRKAMEKDAIHSKGLHAIKDCYGPPPSAFDPAGIYHGGLVGLFLAYCPDSAFGVAGEVYLWGKVTEYAGGYLAQYAYPKKLFCAPEMDVVTIMQLEEEYGVPCEIREEFSRPKPDPVKMYQEQMQQMYQMAQVQVQQSGVQYYSYGQLPASNGQSITFGSTSSLGGLLGVYKSSP